jgi:hypothetical protein
MARTPTVYRWDDPGAPDLSALHPSNDERNLMYFHTVLKACLVDGYGSKAAAGWAMPHEETTPTGSRFVLTNTANSGALLYEGGSFSGGGAHNVDTLWACSVVPDMDSPVNAWSWNVKYADRNTQSSSAVFHKSGGFYKYKCDAWVVIANENTCIVVCGIAADYFSIDVSTKNIGVSLSNSCFVTFGAMHDGFGGVASPGGGNFYIAGGGKGDYDGHSNNLGMQSDLLTSIQGITGVEKTISHVYSYNNPVLDWAYHPTNFWFPTPIFYTVYGDSFPDWSGNPGYKTMAAMLVGVRKLAVTFGSINTGRVFMVDGGYSYGVPFSLHGVDWMVFRSISDIADVISLSPDEWGV